MDGNAVVESGMRGPAADFGHGGGQGRKASGKVWSKRILLVALLVGLTVFSGRAAYRWWMHDRFFTTTDDAYVAADVTRIAAKVSGYVAAMEVTPHQGVTAGDVIARLDDGDYRLAVAAVRDRQASQEATIARIARQIEAARVGVRQAVAQADAARASLVQATADFARKTHLGASRVVSVATVDAARAVRDTARAALKAAEAAHAQAAANVAVVEAQRAEAESVRNELKTALAKAERDLSFTVIRAPVNGRVGARAVETGAYVQPGTRIIALIASDGVHIDANFKETQIADIRPGAPVEVSVDAYPGKRLEGSVISVSPATGATFSLLPADNATGNFTKIVQRVPVRLGIRDPEGILRTGMSVVVGVDRRVRP